MHAECEMKRMRLDLKSISISHKTANSTKTKTKPMNFTQILSADCRWIDVLLTLCDTFRGVFGVLIKSLFLFGALGAAQLLFGSANNFRSK